ncbi:MAG: ABC transporter substrate-binding protein [Chloroflexi bacterium]|nr:ABC transporter substrate-binding protein [Chloroflexota bacterium]
MRLGVLRTLGGLLAAVAAVGVLGACGPSEQPATPAATATPTRPAPTPTLPLAVATVPGPVVATPTPVPTRAPTPPPGPKRGGTMNITWSNDPDTIGALRAISQNYEVIQALYDYLIFQNRDGLLEPQLAQSWKASEDGKSITLSLVPGVKFHDGSDFNAQAVKNDLERKKDPKWKSVHAKELEFITSIDVVDNLTVRFNFKDRDVTFLPRGLASGPGMLESTKAYEGVTPETWAGTLGRKPVAAGSFKIVEWRSDAHILMERWDKGFGQARGLPYLDAIRFRIINDPTVALANFRSGGTDLYLDAGRTQAIPLLKEAEGGFTTYYQGWNPAYGYLALNRLTKPLDDVRVRKAISHAIDREAFVQSVLGGDGAPLYTNIPPHLGWLYDPNYKKWDYNLAEAKRLMVEAGYPDGFTLDPVIWGGGVQLQPYIEAVADMVGKIGIKFKLQLLTSAQASNLYQVDWKAAAYLSQKSCPEDPDRCFREHFHSKSPLNTGAIKLPGLDELIDLQKTQFAVEDRKKSLLQARDIIVDNVSMVFVYATKATDFYRPYVKGLKTYPRGRGHQNYFETWLDK